MLAARPNTIGLVVLIGLCFDGDILRFPRLRASHDGENRSFIESRLLVKRRDVNSPRARTNVRDGSFEGLVESV